MSYVYEVGTINHFNLSEPECSAVLASFASALQQLSSAVVFRIKLDDMSIVFGVRSSVVDRSGFVPEALLFKGRLRPHRQLQLPRSDRCPRLLGHGREGAPRRRLPRRIPVQGSPGPDPRVGDFHAVASTL
ncbi:MAG: hypothetical protein M1311_02305 [Thaumarchaeota archaeon]|nr:hypothetical protein [Nitrososphaerota archaeon]MDG6937328.1 hypothetical protein [Nitrososphaerota archaeon]